MKNPSHLLHAPEPGALFVYGTLMRGCGNHRYLTRARFVRAARTAPRFTLVNLGAYPALLAIGTTSVHGEMYEVDDENLATVDRLEGVPHFYRRELVELRGRALVFAYVLPSDGRVERKVIESGDWRNRCESKS